MSSGYKLTYFNIRGRGEPIRLIFALAKVKYDERTITFQEWPNIRDTTPWGTVPFLEADGHTYSQTVTIARFLAKRFNLVGSNEYENTKCDELVDAAIDLGNEQINHMLEKDESLKPGMKKKIIEVAIPHFFKKFNDIQKTNGGSYMVGPNVTWADLFIANVVERLDDRFGDDIRWAEYPYLKRHRENFFSIPQIKEYVSVRPPSHM